MYFLHIIFTLLCGKCSSFLYHNELNGQHCTCCILLCDNAHTKLDIKPILTGLLHCRKYCMIFLKQSNCATRSLESSLVCVRESSRPIKVSKIPCARLDTITLHTHAIHFVTLRSRDTLLYRISIVLIILSFKFCPKSLDYV
jgi:hypothetical protein